MMAVGQRRDRRVCCRILQCGEDILDAGEDKVVRRR